MCCITPSGNTVHRHQSEVCRIRISGPSPAKFSTFSTDRMESGLRFYSSFRIRIKSFKFHCFGIWRQHNH